MELEMNGGLFTSEKRSLLSFAAQTKVTSLPHFLDPSTSKNI